MKRTALRKVGKIGSVNLEARKKIAILAEELGLNYCEIGLQRCLVTSFLAPAHRHKRAFYKGNVELLADYEQWVAACQNCHNQIEHDKELTERFFNKLRPI